MAQRFFKDQNELLAYCAEYFEYVGLDKELIKFLADNGINLEYDY